MVLYCCAYGCKEKFVKGGQITFHKFPRDSCRRKQWEILVRRKDFVATEYSRLCSKHFEEKCYDKEKFGGTWLKADAKPTIFDFPPHVVVREPSPEPEKPAISVEESFISNGVLHGKRLCYLGDFSSDHMKFSELAQEALEIAKLDIFKKNKQIHLLQQTNRRLKKKVSSLKQALAAAKKKARLSKSAVSALPGLVKDEALSEKNPQNNIDDSSDEDLLGASVTNSDL